MCRVVGCHVMRSSRDICTLDSSRNLLEVTITRYMNADVLCNAARCFVQENMKAPKRKPDR